MTVHDRAAKTYKTLNDAGRSHDECLREAVNAAIEEAAKVAEGVGFPLAAIHIRALSDGGQKND